MGEIKTKIWFYQTSWQRLNYHRERFRNLELSKPFTVVIQPLSTRLIKPNLCVIPVFIYPYIVTHDAPASNPGLCCISCLQNIYISALFASSLLRNNISALPIIQVHPELDGRTLDIVHCFYNIARHFSRWKVAFSVPIKWQILLIVRVLTINRTTCFSKTHLFYFY